MVWCHLQQPLFRSPASSAPHPRAHAAAPLKYYLQATAYRMLAGLQFILCHCLQLRSDNQRPKCDLSSPFTLVPASSFMLRTW
jgi:hypothetical protein